MNTITLSEIIAKIEPEIHIVLSGPAHPNQQGLFLDPSRPWYVYILFFCEKIKKIDHLFNPPTSLENILGIY